MPTRDDANERRDFLRLCGRSVLLGAVAFGAARLFVRRQVSLSGQTCVNDGICPTCRKHADCGLPQALSRRQAQEGSPS